MRIARLSRFLALAATGGVVLQAAGGCGTQLLPLAISLGEQVLLSVLLSGTGGLFGGAGGFLL